MLQPNIKKFFFDRAVVVRAMDKVTRGALSKAGSFVRRRAQTSMGYRKPGGPPSPPGSPPFARRGGGGKGKGRGPLLRKFLYFGYDPSTHSVVVGPVRLGRSDAPTIEEFGGTTIRQKIVRVATRKATPTQSAAFRRKIKLGQIKTSKAPRKTYVATYPARPFMGPALKKEVAAGNIPSQWSNSIRKSA